MDGPNKDSLESNSPRVTQTASASGGPDAGDLPHERRSTQGREEEAVQPDGSPSDAALSQVASSPKRRSTRRSKKKEELGKMGVDEALETTTDRPLADSGADEGEAAAVVARVNSVVSLS
ncbi:hypothetical protein ACSSS7_002777 [Eimeria intestinalis]